MENKAEESFPTPPPYIISDGSKTALELGIPTARTLSSASLPPPPPTLFTYPFPPAFDDSNQRNTSLPDFSAVSATPTYVPRVKFVSYERALYRSPALTTCPACETQVTTQVTFRVGTHAWLMCLVFVLCGLLLGCCLIPFFLNCCKDAYHTCPRCNLVLHVQRRTCCE